MSLLVFKNRMPDHLESIYQISIQLKLEVEQQEESIQGDTFISLLLLDLIIRAVMKLKVLKIFQAKQ